MASTGWLTPTSTGSPNNDWAAFGDPTRAFVEDDILISVNGAYQDYADFSVPTLLSGTVIDGIQVRTKGTGSVSPTPKCGIEISWDGGTNYTSTGKQTSHSGTDKGLPFFSTVGGATDKWGRTWANTDFTNSNLRVRLSNAVSVFAIDVLEINIHYTYIPLTRSISGTLLTSGDVIRTLFAERSISGSLIFNGGARATVLWQVEDISGKTYLYKVYDEDGSFIEVWKDVIDEPNFTHEINSIGSNMTVELARNSDSLGTTTAPLTTEDSQNITTEGDENILVTTESRNQIGDGSSVNYNNRVDIMAYYGEVAPLLTEDSEIITTEDEEDLLAEIGSPSGRRIFTGFISDINSRYGNTETTVVQLTSYGYDLDQYPITNDSDETTVAYSSEDPSDIALDAMDRFVAASSGESYNTYTLATSASISITGTTVSYTFRVNSYKDVLDKVLELMPSNWYYYVGLGDNTVYFRERAVNPKHLFYLGKHIKAEDVRGSILDVKNHVLFTGGGDPALFRERKVTPAARTRRGLEIRSDSRVTLDDSADIISEGITDQSNKVQYRTTVEVLSKQYDIESITVGDLVGFRNFGNYVDDLKLQVIGLSYQPDLVQLQLETKPPTINKRLEDVVRNLKVTENQNAPDQPS